jgi:hypothetical protein
MRIAATPDGLSERIGLMLNRLPTPIGEAMFAMPVARSLQVAQRTGMLPALAEDARDPVELAEHLGLQPTATKLVLDVIASLGHVELRADGRYQMSDRARRWLDPHSDHYLGDFLADTAEYWRWWGDLEDLVRTGGHAELHDRPADDPYWRSYILGQYQLARLSSAEVAKAVPLRPGAHSLLDVAGAHGEFSMALCRRHPGLKATIVDLPGSARIGREIVSGAGMDDRVRHVEGDMFEADFGGSHDGALCFNIVHHLTPERARGSASSSSTTGRRDRRRTPARSSASSSTSPRAPTPTRSSRSRAGSANPASMPPASTPSALCRALRCSARRPSERPKLQGPLHSRLM